MNSQIASDRVSILYADGDAENRRLIENIYKYDYQFSHCSLGKCLDNALTQKPDIVILEMNGEMDEYSLEIGHKLREQVDHATTSLVYLANDVSNEMRFRCYDSGADDVINKPFDIHSLIKRIELLLKSKKAEYELKLTQEQAQKLVSSTINIVGEQGVVIHFFQDSISLNTYPVLTQKLFEELSSLGLSGVMAIWCDEEIHYSGSDGIIHPIEMSILEVAYHRDKKKISTYGQRCLVLGKQSTLLIRNLPDDLEKAGRYKDLLAMLVDGIDLICNQILLKNQLSRSEMQLMQTMLLTNQSITTLKSRTSISRGKINVAINDLVTKMEQKFMGLGLTEEQENEVINLVLNTNEVIDLQITEIYSQEEELGQILENSGSQRWKNSR